MNIEADRLSPDGLPLSPLSQKKRGEWFFTLKTLKKTARTLEEIGNEFPVTRDMQVEMESLYIGFLGKMY